MNVFTVMAKLTADDREYQRTLRNAERTTEVTTRKMEGSFTTAFNNIARSAARLGQGMTRVGDSMSRGVTAPLVALGAAALASANQLGNAADKILDLSTISGMSTDRIQALRAVTREAGIEADAFARASEGLTRRLSATGEETDTVQRGLALIGVSARTSTGQLRSMDDLLPEIIRGLASMENASQRNALATDLLGRSALTLAPALALGADRIDEITAAAMTSGEVMSGDALEAANAYRIEWANLTTELGVAGRQIQESLIPVMTAFVRFTRDTLVPAVRGLAERVASVIEWFGNLDGSTQRIIVTFGLFLAAVGPVLSIVGRLLQTLPLLTGAVTALRTATLALAVGPAAPLVLFAAALSGIALALNGARGSVTYSIDETVRKMTSGPDSLVISIDTVVDKIDGDFASSLRGIQDELAETGHVGVDAMRQIARAMEAVRLKNIATQSHAGIIARAMNVEITDAMRVAGAPMFDFRRIPDADKALLDALDRGDLNEALRITREVVALLDPTVGAVGAIGTRTFEALQEFERELQRSIETVETADFTVEVSPYVRPARGVAGATTVDPTGLKTLESDGVDVEVRYRAAPATGAMQGPGMPSVPDFGAPRGARAMPTPGVTAVTAPAGAIPVPGALVSVGDAVAARAIRNAERLASILSQAAASAGLTSFTDELERLARLGREGVRIPVPGVTAGLVAPSAIPVPDVTATAGPATNVVPLTPGNLRAQEHDAGARLAAHRAEADKEAAEAAEAFARSLAEGEAAARAESEARQAQIDATTREKTSRDFTADAIWTGGQAAAAFGLSVLDVAKQKVPALGAAIDGFAQGGPLGALAAVFSTLLTQSEGFSNLMGALNRVLEPIAKMLGSLADALVPLIDAVAGIWEVTSALLQPSFEILGAVFRAIGVAVQAVADIFKRVYNAMARLLPFLRPIEDKPGDQKKDDERAPAGSVAHTRQLVEQGRREFERAATDAQRENWQRFIDIQQKQLDALLGIEEATTQEDIGAGPGSAAYLRQQIAELQEFWDRATDDIARGHLQRAIDRRQDELDRMRGGDASPSAPERRDPETLNLSRTPQGFQLAAATPIVEASVILMNAAMKFDGIMARLLPTGGMGLNALPPFTSAIERMTPVLERLLSEGVGINVNQTTTSSRAGSTALLRGL